jgi:predicted RNA-binding protein Jag
MRKQVASLDALPSLIAAWTQHLGLDVEVKPAPSGDEELFPNRFALSGLGSEWLGANKGEGLDALQFLVHESQGSFEDHQLAYLDVNGTRLFRMKEVVAMATFAADKAREVGSHLMGALSPRERRWVHITLERAGDVVTESEGTGTFKAVRVSRKN